jgi:hypothetical protein
MARLDIQMWAKTPDGIECIQAQKPFCLGGVVWQGMNGAAFRCPENVLTTDELRDMPDKDGTISEVWKRRRQRLEARQARKQKEYDETKRLLRQKRNEIRESIKTDKAENLPVNPDDIEEIRRIDERMSRLNDSERQLEIEISKMVSGKAPERKVVLTDAQDAPAPEATCERCGKIPPPDHPSPTTWLRGHNIQCKLKHAKAS